MQIRYLRGMPNIFYKKFFRNCGDVLFEKGSKLISFSSVLLVCLFVCLFTIGKPNTVGNIRNCIYFIFPYQRYFCLEGKYIQIKGFKKNKKANSGNVF